MEQSSPATVWQPLGPEAVVTSNYGLVTGRISSLALDSSDATGNTLYVGTTGGGVWLAHNAATSDPTNISFVPLTDYPSAIVDITDATISIGALTVQPGGTGVVLAGTGDPNDALDSYYGAGVLRSTDGGNSWSLIRQTTLDDGAGNLFSFLGEGFAGFAWSTVNPQLVVAAVSQAYEGQLVDAEQSHYSYTGLYYSKDAGAHWNLARITDLNGQDVQGPNDALIADGNPATAVVWNPIRNLFIAAVRFHGYYQSSDGVNWTRLANQPGGSALSTTLCPTNSNMPGSPACPILRGSLAVNPLTGDTFAWTVDLNNQDIGLWQDVCGASGTTCTNQTITFGKQWSTAPIESNTLQGSATIANGDYNLTLAAVPSGQDTILLAGANDLWKCSLATGCTWRNATNSTTCMTAEVGEYQHSFAWSAANPLEIFIGNDSGLWRSEDAIAETGSACSPSDASHFQNLNGSIGSLAEAQTVSQIGASPFTMMAALGANGTAGVKSTTGPTAQWPQILGGEGGPVAIDPTDLNKWYVNNGAGVAIHLCDSASGCAPSDFGAQPAVSSANVGNDGLTMTAPVPFLIDPVDPSQLLIGTCRVWRGPASGSGWTAANAISPMLDGNHSSSYCNGNALIRSMAAQALPGGGEVVYVGTYSALNGGGTLPGHVLTATMGASGVWSPWSDLTLNPVTNNIIPFNLYGLDISSLTIDPHDTTGNTIYVTVAGIPDSVKEIGMAYRSIDGGAHWKVIGSNLPFSTANATVVDPADANTVYIATDLGVYSTRQIATCESTNCWAVYGTGLPASPVTTLRAAPAGVTPNVLVAATYGRGLWQIPLLTAGMQMTTASADHTSLTFADQPESTTSRTQPITITNTGAIGLGITSVTVNGDFAKTENCTMQVVNAGSSCTINVSFTPQALGTQSGQLTIAGNLSGGSVVVNLSGKGTVASTVQLTPGSIDFGTVEDGTTSAPLQVSAQNPTATAIHASSVTVTGPFLISSNVCGTSIAPNSSCQINIEFQPTTPGPATGVLTMVDDAGTQSVQLSGTGTAPPTDTLSTTSVSFPDTIIGTNSMPLAVTLSNSGGNPLTNIAVTVSGPFQQSSNCTTQLSAAQSCSVSVTFLPTAQGKQTGTLSISDILRAQPQVVALSGTGLLPPVISVDPASLSFSSQQVATASTPAVLTVTNSGGAAMSNIGSQITGPSATSYTTGTTNCGATLDVKKSCTIQVTFKPLAAGAASASLTLTSSTAGVKSVVVPLNGTGSSSAALTVTPAQLSFDAQALGQASPPQTVTIANSGVSAATGLTLAASSPFSIAQSTCSASLAANSSCTAGIVFTPMQNGNLAGTLTISSTSVSPATTVALSGIGGLTGAVQVQPAQLSFPTTGVGATSKPSTVTFTNTSSAVALANLSLKASTGFQISANTCGTELTPGASCTASVAFAPVATGALTGTLTLTSSNLGAPVAVPLSGSGFDFTIANSGSATQTVASGTTATFSITLTPAAGDSATFTFQCSSLPSYASCVFNPAQNNVAANSTGTEVIQISTSQSVSGQAQPLPIGPPSGMLLICGVFLLPFARRARRWLTVLIGAVALTACVSCCSSGGGGGSTPPSDPGSNKTPAGTYSIPVAISANGETHTVTLTLVVD